MMSVNIIRLQTYENFQKKDNYLLTLLFSCRNKLADIFNCIGDDNWKLPDTYLDITPTTDDTITELNDKLYFTCKSNYLECYKFVAKTHRQAYGMKATFL